MSKNDFEKKLLALAEDAHMYDISSRKYYNILGELQTILLGERSTTECYEELLQAANSLKMEKAEKGLALIQVETLKELEAAHRELFELKQVLRRVKGIV